MDTYVIFGNCKVSLDLLEVNKQTKCIRWHIYLNVDNEVDKFCILFKSNNTNKKLYHRFNDCYLHISN